MEVQLVGYRRGIGSSDGVTFFNCQPDSGEQPFEIEISEELAKVLIEHMANGRNRYRLDYIGPVKDFAVPGRLTGIED
jgi:hypothetical protein